jgi:regulator of nucleoside diphosphate kinase
LYRSLRKFLGEDLSWVMIAVQSRLAREENNGMKNPIHITTQDKQRLEDLLIEVEASDPRKHGDLKALKEELHRAVIVNPKDVAGDVITMNSRAEMRDLETGETVAFTLVFPSEADVDKEKISVLAPIGAGMLGYRVGDEFQWNVPGGLRRMKVTQVYYQPEAAGDFDR